MMTIVAIVILLAVFLCLIAFLKNKNHGKDSDRNLDSELEFPYYSKRPLTKSEQALYYKLVEALPEYNVLPQVGLSRFLGVKKGHNFGQWFNRINRMSVDYLICTKEFEIIAAIELDDPTHDKPDRIAADAKKDKALESAEIYLIRWKSVPNIPTMRSEVLKHLSK